jgi:hypothetical protein
LGKFGFGEQFGEQKGFSLIISRENCLFSMVGDVAEWLKAAVC